MGLMINRGASAEYRVPDATEPGAAAVENVAPLLAMARFADGAETPGDRALLRRAFDAYLSDSGNIPLERCLGLPSTHMAWRKLQRNSWLCRAAALIDADSPWSCGQKLEAEWDRFITRGPWQAWRDDEAPPAYATDLNRALFYATRMNRSVSLNAKQIARIVGQTFTEKSP